MHPNGPSIDKLMINDEWYQEDTNFALTDMNVDGYFQYQLKTDVGKTTSPLRMGQRSPIARSSRSMGRTSMRDDQNGASEDFGTKQSQDSAPLKFNEAFAKHLHVRHFVRKLKGKNIKALQPYHFNMINDASSGYSVRAYQTQSSSVKKQRVTRLQRFKQRLQTRMTRLIHTNQLFNCFPIIQPESQSKFFWDLWVTLIRIFLFYMITVEFTFSNNLLYDKLFEVLVISLISLFIDILLQFNTAYYQQGVLVDNRTYITINYLTNEFWMDITSFCILLGITVHKKITHQNFISARQVAYPDYLNFILLISLLQIRNIFRVIRKIEESYHFKRSTMTLLDLIKLILIVASFEHIFSCIWCFTGRWAYFEGMKSWMSVKRNVIFKSYQEQYLYSFYFATVTMVSVGYGDISPTNDYEVLVSIFFLFCSCIQLSYSVTSLIGIIAQLNQQKEHERIKLRTINMFMQDKKISQQLQVKVREYLTFVWQEESNEADAEQQKMLIEQLSQQIRDDLMLEANRPILQDCVLFSQHFSNSFKKRILAIIKSLRLFPESTIDSSLDMQNDQFLFFVEKGSIRFELEGLNQRKGKGASIIKFQKGENFGLECFVSGQRQQEIYRSLGFSQLLYISRSEFIEILKDYPDDYEQFCHLRDKENSLPNKCYSCQSNNHRLNDCPRVHHIPSKEKIIKTHIYSLDQQRSRRCKNRRLVRYQSLKELQFIQDVTEAYQIHNENIIDQLYEDDQEQQSALNEKTATVSQKAESSAPKREKGSVLFKEIDSVLQISPGKSMLMSNISKKHREIPKLTLTFLNKNYKQNPLNKFRRAVRKISFLRRFHRNNKDIAYHRFKNIKQNQDLLQFWPKVNLKVFKNFRRKEQEQIEYLLIQQKLQNEEDERLVFISQFELLHDFKFYKPFNNFSNIVKSYSTKIQDQNISRWIRYMNYPWEFMSKYQSKTRRGSQLKLNKTLKGIKQTVFRHRNKVYQYPESGRRISRGFALQMT